jgi:phage/plasmid-associated DNA primase
MAPITIAKTVNAIQELDFVEEFDKEDALRLLNSTFLSDTWSLGYATDLAKQLYENEKKQIEDYVTRYDDDLKGVPVKYIKKKASWGRPHVAESLGFTAFRKQVRHTFAKKYYDIDLKNAQVALLVQLCMRNAVPPPAAVVDYVTNREKVLMDTAHALNIERSEAKTMFLRLVFYGTYEGFVLAQKDEGKTGYPAKPPPFITAFMAGVRSVVAPFKKANPSLHKYVQRSENERHRNKDGQFMALYLQEYESVIVGDLLAYLANSHADLVASNGSRYVNASYEFDGIKLLRTNVDDFPGGLKGVIDIMESFIRRKFEISLEFEEKPIDGGYDLSGIEPADFRPKRLPKARVESLITAMKYFNQDDAVKLLTDKYSSTYVYIKPDNMWCCWDGKKWVFDDVRVFMSLVDEVNNHFSSQFTKDNLAQHTNLNTAWLAFRQRTSNCSWRQGVLKTAEKALSCYDMEFDAETDLVGFENGVYDISKREFRPAEKTDFVTMSCKYDFRFYDEPVGEDKEIEDELFEKVFNKVFPDPEVRTLFLVMAASGISGRAIEHFFILNGSGRNGKGLCNQALEMAYGDYFYHASYAILTEDPKKKTSGDANPDLANVDKMRYVIMKEPPKDSPLNNNVIKDLTGGGTVKARRLYKDKCDVRLHGTFGMETNAKAPLREEATTADAERIIDLLYASTFTSNPSKVNKDKHIYPLDPTLKEKSWWKRRINGLMNILLRYLDMLRKEDYKMAKFIPASVRRRSMEYLQSSYLPHRIFVQLFERKEEGRHYLPDTDFSMTHIVQFITSSKQWYALPPSIRAKPEHSDRAIRNWFGDSDVYGPNIYAVGKLLYLGGYREIPLNDAQNEDEETSEEDFEMNSFSSGSV